MAKIKKDNTFAAVKKYINHKKITNIILSVFLMSMKKNLFATIILCMMATLSTKAQVYVLDDAAERKANCEYVFTGPPSQLTFEAKKQWASIGGLKFEQYVNGSWIGSTDVSSLGTSYKNYGPFQLDKKATKIRFVKNADQNFSKDVVSI